MSQLPPPLVPNTTDAGSKPVLPYAIPGQSSTGVVCPKCGGSQIKVVTFTWWGGLLGPKLLHHVKCLRCGEKFNGKTGRSNTTGIVIYSVVGLVIALAAIFIFWILQSVR